MVFTSKHNMEITKMKNYWKKRKKFFWNFSRYDIRHPRKGVVQNSPNTCFQKRWFLPANTTWKWQVKKVKNYWKSQKKNFRGFFSIWRYPRKGVVQGFPNTHFQQFFKTAFKQSENQRYWRYLEIFEDI